MSYSLNSLKGVTQGIISGTTIGLIRGDTRSLDYSSYGHPLSLGGGGGCVVLGEQCEDAREIMLANRHQGSAVIILMGLGFRV